MVCVLDRLGVGPYSRFSDYKILVSEHMMLKTLPSPRGSGDPAIRGTVLSETFSFAEIMPSSLSPHSPTMIYQQRVADAVL